VTHTATPARADTRSVGAQRSGIAVYLLLAFGLAWLPLLPAAIGREPVAVFLMPVAPAVACIIVRMGVTREGFGDAGLHPCFRQWWTYLLAVTWPLAVVVVSVVVATILRTAPHGFALPWGLSQPSLGRLVGLFLLSIVLAPIFLGEELGWRGYLQLRLFQARPLLAGLTTGFIWGVWHYPMILSGGQPTESIAQTLLLLPVSMMAMSVLLGWMRSRTGSLWPGTVAHAANNVTHVGLTSVAFTGTTAGTLPASASVPVIVGELVVWGVIVAVGSRWRNDHRRRLSMAE
jgi:uncharacterized protein